MIMGRDVVAAAEACRGFLAGAVDRDWLCPVPGLEFTVASVVAHAAGGPLWYAVDLWSGPEASAAYAAFDLDVRADAPNSTLLTGLCVAARLCAASVQAAPASLRGYHPAGAADPSGFAAMACDELLVHTHDAATGLGLEFGPDRELAGRVLARLFPWHRAGDDPWRTLLWANGRIELDGRPRPSGWRWHCAPLSEWDGQPPRPSPAG